MKTKILFAALIFMFFEAKTYSQSCDPNGSLKFTGPIQAGGYVCIFNGCTSTYCCYDIPACSDGVDESFCLDGLHHLNSSYCTCSGATTKTLLGTDYGNDPTDPCIEIDVTNYNSTIFETYKVFYDGATDTWHVYWITGNHFTVDGTKFPDYFLGFDGSTGTLHFQKTSGAPSIDDEGQEIVL
jgi:hypothetical protein